MYLLIPSYAFCLTLNAIFGIYSVFGVTEYWSYINLLDRLIAKWKIGHFGCNNYR